MLSDALQEYMANIQVVDEIVKQTEELMREFYKDEETAFIFTADHGMSKIGNHGDGGKVRVFLSGLIPRLIEYSPPTYTRPRQYTYTVDCMGQGRSRSSARQRSYLA